MNLFEITSELRALADQWADSDQIPDEVLQQLTALEIPAEAKTRSIIGLIKENEAEADAIKEQAKRLNDLAKCRANKADRLRDYLRLCLDMLAVKRFSCDLGDASVTQGQPSMRPVDHNLDGVADEFIRHKIEPDIAKAKEHWRATGEVPSGFMLVDGRPSVRIR